MPELSTATSTTMLLPSGEYEASIATMPINYLDAEGEWAPIDSTLVEPTAESDAPEESEGGVAVEEVAAENAAAGHTVSIPEDAAETPLRVATDDAEGVLGGEAWVTLNMDGMAGAPQVEDDTATFTQVEGADAVQLQPTATGMKETIILEQPPVVPESGDSPQAPEEPAPSEDEGAAGPDDAENQDGPQEQQSPESTQPGAGEQAEAEPAAPAALSYSYRIQASAGIAPVLSETGTVDFVRGSGAQATTVFRIPVGNMFDSAEIDTADGAAPPEPAYSNEVAYSLEEIPTADGGGWQFTLTPDIEWLTDPARVYPVMIDPDIELVTNREARDCSLYEDQPNVLRCGNQVQYLRTGKVGGGQRRRAVLFFNAFGQTNTNPNGQVIPADAQITHGNVQLWLAPSETTYDGRAAWVMNRASKSFRTEATWNSPTNQPSANPWGTNKAGGGPTGPNSQRNYLYGGEPSAWRYFNIDDIARGWHAGDYPNNGVVLKQLNEDINTQIAFHSSSNANPTGRHPRLNIRYRPSPQKIDASAGERDFWEFEERELNDRMTAKINIGNGNLLLQNEDLSVKGVAGWDMSMTRYYNSTRHNTGGPLGAGWSHGFGGDGSVQLDFPDNSASTRSKVRFWGPSGYRTIFNRDEAQNGTAKNTYEPEKPSIKADLEWQPGNNRYELKWFDESRYFFTSAGRLISMLDKNDNKLEMAYSSDNRLRSVTDTRNRVLTFAYGTASSPTGANSGLIETATLRRPGPSGSPESGAPMLKWTYEYDTSRSPAQLEKAYISDYDDAAIGSGTSQVDDNEGADTQYFYAANGLLLRTEDASGSNTRFSYDSGTPRVETMDRALRMPDGSVDDDYARTSFSYAATPAASSDGTCRRSNDGPTDEDAAFRTHVNGERTDVADLTKYCIDSDGRVLRTTDARDNNRSTTWTDNSNVDEADLTGTGTGEKQYNYEYDKDDENLRETKSPEGATTRASYDSNSAHNPAAVQGDDSGGNSNTWLYRYDDDDNLIRAKSGVQPGKDKLDIVYEYCWTNSGQISRIMPGDGDQNAGNNGSDIETGEDNVTCNPTGGQGDDTIFTYNSLGELTQVNRPAGGDQTFTYDNLSRIATVTDGEGVTTRYVYDAYDRVVEVRHVDNPNRPGGARPDEIATWDYDLAGNIRSMGNIVNSAIANDPTRRIPTKTFGYDSLNRLTSEEPQQPSSRTDYAYDPAGNLTEVKVESETQAGLEPTKYTYDPVNNVSSIDDQRPGALRVTFGYDNKDNRTRTTYPLTTSSGAASGDSLIHRARYNDDSNAMCMWSYRQANSATDDLENRECATLENANRLITYRGYSYKNGSQQTSTKYGQTDLGGTNTDFTYDAIKRLTKAQTGTDNNNPVRQFDYEYTKRSNIEKRTVKGSNPDLTIGKLSMAYNDGDEICASMPGDSFTGTLGCNPDNGPAGRTVYRHDASGNLLTAVQKNAPTSGPPVPAPLAGLSLAYNLPRQTETITPPGGGTSPTSGPQSYDGVEQDRRTTAGNTTMSYGYAGQVNAQRLGSPATGTGQIFVRDPAGDLIAMLSRSQTAPGTITAADYYLLDDQKSVMATHDGTGNLTGDGLIRYLYEPYGKIIRSWTQNTTGSQANGNDRSQDGNAPAPASDANPFTYASGYHDRATGLIKFGTRYYIPNLMRWTQHDPEQGQPNDPLTIQRFQYVEQDPVNQSDPTGRFSGTDLLSVLTVATFALGLLASAPVSAPLAFGAAVLGGTLGATAIAIDVGCRAGNGESC